jgi:CheY-like chemotaxis protein
MALPLFRRPGSVAFLDDDEIFLEFLGTSIPDRWNAAFFTAPDAFLAHLQQETPFWEADAWNQQEIVKHWRERRTSLPEEVLSYWSRYTERYAPTRVCVVDQLMPGITGIEVLRELGGWHGLRVLLTGQATDAVAVTAFNERLIDRFATKRGDHLTGQLTTMLQELQDSSDERLDQIWRSTLSAAQHQLLQCAAVAAELAPFLRRHFIEYVVIGEPFAVLGLTAQGDLGCVPLVMGDSTPADVSDRPVRDCLGGLPGKSNTAPAIAFGQDGGLAGAFFALQDIPRAPARTASYAAWLKRQAPRNVETAR